MSQGFVETLVRLKAAGTALTAAARASATQGAAATSGRFTLPPNKVKIGDVIHLWASGTVSTVITTPGTLRFDLSFAGTANFDTLAMNPKTSAAKTNVGWVLDVRGTCREEGTTGNFIWQGVFYSEALLDNGVVNATASGYAIVPYNTAPAVGANVDLTVSQLVDLQFTQTVATGSMTLQQYILKLETSSGY